MKCDQRDDSCCGAHISQREATIFLLFVDLIISGLCVFLFVTTYICNAEDEDFNRNKWFLFAFFIWHASKLVIVSLGIVGSLKSIPSYLIPYTCYWGLLTALLLLYSLLVVILYTTKMETNEDYAGRRLDPNETSTSYPLPANKMFESKNILQLVLEYSLNNVILIAAIIIIIAVFSGYFTITIYGFHTSLKKEIQKTQSHLAAPPEVTGFPTEI